MPDATAGIAASILCGPVMPLNMIGGIHQALGNWITRMGFFVGMGMLSGAISSRIKHRHERIERLHSGAITALVRTIDAKSPYTARHSERVAYYAGITERALGIPRQSYEDLRWAGYVHDIGKLWIPDEVLDKSGPLAEGEWELIRQHPVVSEQLLSDVDEF